MRTAGFHVASRVARRLQRHRRWDGIWLEDLPATVMLDLTSLEVQFVGDRHVPQVVAEGYVAEVDVSSVELPYDIQQVTFGDEVGSVAAFTLTYDLDNEEIKALVDKGMYNTGFSVAADDIANLRWAVPTTINLSVFSPGTVDEPAMALIDLNTITEWTLDSDHVSLPVVQSFPDFSGMLIDVATDTEFGAVREGDYCDIFADKELPDYDEQVGHAHQVEDKKISKDMVTAIKQLSGDEELGVYEVSDEHALDQEVAENSKVSAVEQVYREKIRQRKEDDKSLDKSLDESLDALDTEATGEELGDDDLSAILDGLDDISTDDSTRDIFADEDEDEDDKQDAPTEQSRPRHALFDTEDEDENSVEGRRRTMERQRRAVKAARESIAAERDRDGDGIDDEFQKPQLGHGLEF